MRQASMISVAFLLLAARLPAEPAAPLSALAKMPVKEITVFKDGHAFVLHYGKMPVDAQGNVLLDYLPTPVIGTFWPYANEATARLHSVTSGRRRVKVERTAMTMRELVEANIGAEVMLSEANVSPYPATLVQVLTRNADEMEATSAAAAEHVPLKSNLLLVRTVEGTRAVPIERIHDIKFVKQFSTKTSDEEYRNLLTLRLDWGGQAPEKTADVGMAYLQKGVRWIPNYRIDLDGKGSAAIKLQATLLNELTDLDDVTVHLVVGVPSFYFKDTVDPLALNQVLTQLSPYFRNDAETAYALSNSMMTQTARMREVQAAPGGAPAVNLGPEIGGAKSEDLFVFTVKNVTLKKGQRLVLPVAEYKLNYRDVHVLEIPYGPPPEMRRTNDNPQIAEMLRLLRAPKVQHKVRLNNSAAQPLTTAPALLLKNGRVLAQALMTYTAPGAGVDLAVTTAVDVKVKKNDKEAKRTPNAATFNKESFWRIDIDSALELTNYQGQAIDLEITRFVLGNVGAALEDGKAEMVNLLEDDDYLPAGARPTWWGYYSWPVWWSHFNGIGKVTWTKKLEAGKSVELKYNWHYYWR